MSRSGVDFDDRILRFILMESYLPLASQLMKNPNSLKTMVKQLIICEILLLVMYSRTYHLNFRH